MMAYAPVEVVNGSAVTVRSQRSGKVLVWDLRTKKIVWNRPVTEDHARSFMDAMIEDLKQLTISEFQAK